MIDWNMTRLGALACVGVAFGSPAFAGALTSNNFMVPDKDVILHCAPLRYEFHCTISRMANPRFSSFCFYVGPGGQSYLMKRDYRFGFHNEIVSIKVNDGLRITAQLREARTGRQANCSE